MKENDMTDEERYKIFKNAKTLTEAFSTIEVLGVHNSAALFGLKCAFFSGAESAVRIIAHAPSPARAGLVLTAEILAVGKEAADKIAAAPSNPDAGCN